MKSKNRPLRSDEDSGSDLKFIFKIIQDLENPYSMYYSKGYLNSEGMTLINILSRYLINRYPWIKSAIVKVRKRKDYETVSKFLYLLQNFLKNSKH